MAKDKANIRKPREYSVHQKAGDGPSGVKQEFDGGCRNARDQMVAATGNGWMNEYYGLAAIQLLKDRRKRGVTRPFIVITAHQTNAICFEHVECVLRLSQAALLIRQRHCGKKTEAPGIIFD